jgi:hypothetical protein
MNVGEGEDWIPDQVRDDREEMDSAVSVMLLRQSRRLLIYEPLKAD